MRTLRLSLAGTVILALLGGLGGAALAQDEASEPTTPAFFERVEDRGRRHLGHRDHGPALQRDDGGR